MTATPCKGQKVLELEDIAQNISDLGPSADGHMQVFRKLKLEARATMYVS